MELQRTLPSSSRIKDEPLPAEFVGLVENLRTHFAKQRELRNALTIALSEPTSVRAHLCILNAELDELATIVSQTGLRVDAQLRTADNFKHGELQTCSRNADIAKRLAELHTTTFANACTTGSSNTNQLGTRVSLANLSDTSPLKREVDEALFGVYSDLLAECERRLISAANQLSTLEEQLVADWDETTMTQRNTTDQFTSNLICAFGAFTACAARVEHLRSALRTIRDRLVGHVHSSYGDSIAQRLATVTSLSDAGASVASRIAGTNKLGNAFASHFLSSDSAASRSVLADLAKRDGDSLGNTNTSNAVNSVTLQTPGRYSSTLAHCRSESENVPHMRIQVDSLAPIGPSKNTESSSSSLMGPSPFSAATSVRIPANGTLAANSGTPQQSALAPSGLALLSNANPLAATVAAGSSPFTSLGSTSQPQTSAARTGMPLLLGTASSTSTPSGALVAPLATGATATASPFALGSPSVRTSEQPQPGTKRAR